MLAMVLSSLPYPVSSSKVWLVTTHTYQIPRFQYSNSDLVTTKGVGIYQSHNRQNDLKEPIYAVVLGV